MKRIVARIYFSTRLKCWLYRTLDLSITQKEREQLSAFCIHLDASR